MTAGVGWGTEVSPRAWKIWQNRLFSKVSRGLAGQK
jgi:hypothetical protein